MNKKYILIIFVAVIALLLYVLFAGDIVHTKEDAVKQQLYAIETALERYKVDYGKFPTMADGLRVLVKEDSKGRYFKNDKFLTDPWRNPIKYKLEYSGSGGNIILYSFGSNGIDENMAGDDIFVSRH